MKTKKNLKNSMKGVAAFSFAAAMVLSLSAFNTVDKKKLTVVADPLTELASTDQSKADNDLARLRQSPYESTFKATLAEYNHEIESREKACEAWHTWRSGDRSAKAEADVAWARENYGTNTRHIRKEITAWQTMRSMYVSRAQAILSCCWVCFVTTSYALHVCLTRTGHPQYAHPEWFRHPACLIW